MKAYRYNRRGQIFSGEFLLAYLIFIAVLGMVYYMWAATTRDILYSENAHNMEETAVDIGEQLIRTAGSPSDWNVTNVVTIGLGNTSRILNRTKVLSFVDIMNASNYEDNKHILGIDRYDFYLNMTSIDYDTLVIQNKTITTGKMPVNEIEKITIMRTAILDGEMVRILLTVWE